MHIIYQQFTESLCEMRAKRLLVQSMAKLGQQGIKARIDVGSVTIIMHPHARLSLYVLIHSTINNTRSEKYLLTESASQSFLTWRIKQIGSIWTAVPSNIL